MRIRNETTDWRATLDYGAPASDYGYLQPGYEASGSVGTGDSTDLIRAPMADGQPDDRI